MGPSAIISIVLAVVVLVTIFVVIPYQLSRFQKAKPGTAIIRTGLGGTRVSFDGLFVFPQIYQADVLDITVKRVTVERGGAEAPLSRDGKPVELTADFYVRVNRTAGDVLRVVQAFGCERAADPAALADYFVPRFAEALKIAAKRFDQAAIEADPAAFRDEAVRAAGTDLGGFALDSAAVAVRAASGQA